MLSPILHVCSLYTKLREYQLLLLYAPFTNWASAEGMAYLIVRLGKKYLNLLVFLMFFFFLVGFNPPWNCEFCSFCSEFKSL